MATALASAPPRFLRPLLFIATGLGIWAAATLLIRVAGHLVLPIDRPLLFAFWFLLPVPLLVGFVRWLFSFTRLVHEQRPAAALYLALPGMFLDLVCLAFYPLIFPNLPLETRPVLGGWLLWCYGVTVATGIASLPNGFRRQPRSFFFLVGCGVAIGGTIFYRLLGQTFFTLDLLGLNVLLSALMAVGFMVPLYWLRAVPYQQRPEAAISFATPIMLVNALSSTFYSLIYPNLPADMNTWYSSVFMLAYALGLLTGLFPHRATMERSQ